MKSVIVVTSFVFLNVFGFSQNIEENNWKVCVKDSTQYDSSFLKYWKYVKPHSLRISNDSIIVGGRIEEAIIIPTDLPMAHKCYYEFSNNGINYSLIVSRLNFTNIAFFIEGKKDNKVIFKRNGEAILESTFYLGSEGLYEKNENEVYGMNDYNIQLNETVESKLLIAQGTKERISYIEKNKNGIISLIFDFKKNVVNNK